MDAARQKRADADPRFPVPLTRAEERLMANRLELQADLEGFVSDASAAPREVASIALEHKGSGRLIVYLTPSADEQKWRSVVVARSAARSNQVVFERASKSMPELQAQADRIVSDLPALEREGFSITRVGVDVRRSPVVVIGQPSDDSAQRQQLSQRYPGVTFEIRGASIALDSRINSASQWKAGLRIQRVGGGTCTAGFTFKTPSGGKFLSTAAHCNNKTSGGIGTTWFHNVSPATGSGNLRLSHTYWGTGVDAAMMELPPAQKFLLSNLEIVQGDRCTNPECSSTTADSLQTAMTNEGRGARVTRKFTGLVVGESWLCKSGYVTGYTCGRYAGTTTAPGPNGTTLGGFGLVNDAPSNCGDSGSPVHYQEYLVKQGEWTVAAAGLLNAGNSEQLPNGSCNAGTHFTFSTIANIEANGFLLDTASTAVPIQAPQDHGGKCIDVPNADTRPAIKLWTYTCNGSPAQMWELRPKYGQYGFVPRSSMGGTGEQCMDIEGGQYADGPAGGDDDFDRVQQYTCFDPSWTNQRFRLRPTNVGTDFEIRPVVANDVRCIDILNYDTANQAVLQQYLCTSNWNQRWHHY